MWDSEQQIIQSKLSGGEQMLWFGRPRQGLIFRFSDAAATLFGVLWCGFALSWEYSVWTNNAPLLFKIWGIPFVLVGLYILVGRFFVDVWQRKKTYYGVTNERIIIISGLFSQKIKSLSLQDLNDLTLELNKNGLGTITFGKNLASKWYGFSKYDKNREDVSPSFEQIPKPETVYEIIRTAKKTN